MSSERANEFTYELELFKKCFELPIAQEIRDALTDCRCTAWVASGLSKVAAECGRRMLQNLAGIPGHLFTPLDYCSSNQAQYLPVLISYHGKNLDIQAVGKSIVGSEHKRAILIAGCEQTPVRAYLERNGVEVHTLCLPEHEEDRRLVAVRATWTMAALCLRLAQAVASLEDESGATDDAISAAYVQAKSLAGRVIERFLRVEDWSNRKWIILGGGITVPAMLAWEAMCAEGALSSVIISDIKDYTHGRYLSAMREAGVGFVVLTEESSGSLGKIIIERFSKLFPVIEIESRGGQFCDLCTHIFLVAFVVSGLASSLGHNLASPPKPQIVNNWRNWGVIKC